MVATNTSIEQHDLKLYDLELVWCCEKPGLFPSHIQNTFAAVRSHLEAHDAKRTNQVQTATEYEFAGFEGTMEGEDEEKQREEREGKGKEGKEEGEKGREEEEEKAREEGDDEQMADVPENVNDIIVMSSIHTPPPRMSDLHPHPLPVPNLHQQDCTTHPCPPNNSNRQPPQYSGAIP